MCRAIMYTQRWIVLLLLSLTMSTALGQTIWYVDDSSTNGLNDGSSWDNAFMELQSALHVATNGHEIRVAQGIYKPDFDVNSNGHTGNRELSFELISGVKLYGGYAGIGAVDPDLRDVDSNASILSGDLAGDDVGTTGVGENAYHVVAAYYVSTNSVLDGFTIIGGNANGFQQNTHSGGGMYNSYSNLTVANCVFIGNRSGNSGISRCGGGGMYNEYSNPIIMNCKFKNNAYIGDWYGLHQWFCGGGGVYDFRSDPTLRNCVFEGNRAYGMDADSMSGGGGLYHSGGCVKIANCVFTRNSAHGNGHYSFGGFNGSGGGGIYGRADLTNCTLTENSTNMFGGGIYGTTGVVLNNCILWGNADNGGFDESGQIHDRDGSLSMMYSCVQGLDMHIGNGNTGEDPLLTWDGIHLSFGSPCINHGEPDGEYGNQEDIDGEARVSCGNVDMGADEFVDIDVDGLPDWWEVLFFGASTAALPGDDPDGDSRENIIEYIENTDPQNAPTLYYVSPSGDDNWDGLSPEWNGTHGPKATIQAGIDVVVSSSGDHVVLLPGIHTGIGNRDLDYGGKAVTVRSIAPTNPLIVAQTIVDCEGSETEPHRGFWFRTLEGPDSVLSGLTIRGGYADEGGAVKCELSRPTLNNCTFAVNSAHLGGGIYNSYSNPVLSNCILSGNLSVNHGGGMYNFASNPKLTKCTFSRNTADGDSDGSNNHCYNSGGGMYNDTSNPVLSNCIFNRNSVNVEADSYHMEMVYHGGGGGMYNTSSNPILTNCIFKRNSTDVDATGLGATFYSGGGGMYNINSNPSLIACVFSLNLTNERTSSNSIFYPGGGGIYNYNSSSELANCIFMGNLATIGGGMCNYSNSDSTVTNCILWGNGGIDERMQIARDAHSMPSLKHCCIQGLDMYVGNSNISDDPLLTKDCIHLQSNSPCVDRGDSGNDYIGREDVDGESIVDDGHVDIGPDEFVDTDVDGLPDWWEVLFFGASTAALPGDDPDGDSRENIIEYIENTDPQNAPTLYYVSVTGDDSWDGLSSIWDGTHGPKATIQAGIDGTHPCEGDTVVILPGIYTGIGNRDLYYDGKAIVVTSEDPTNPMIVSQTIIDCEGSDDEFHYGFCFTTMEGSDSILRGITVRGAYTSYEGGGGIWCELSNPTVENCVLSGNFGCAMGNFKSSPTVTNCTFKDNQVGMYNNHSNPTLMNCAFNRNWAFYLGGAFYNYNSNPLLKNCTITRNIALSGGGLYNRYNSNPILINCVLWGNGDRNGFKESSQIHNRDSDCIPYLSHCCVQGLDTYNGNGNIGNNPLFVNSNGLDGIPGTEDDNLRLQLNSPCINSGDNSEIVADVTTDLDGLPRVHACIVDMGAYEFQGNTYFGDADENCIVDLDDYLDFNFCLERFGYERNPVLDACIQVFDSDGDDDVDLADFAEFQRIFVRL